MDRELLDEIIKIRKTLEDIEFILEYAHVPQKRVEKAQFVTEGGTRRIKRDFTYYSDPLEHLRQFLNECRQNKCEDNASNP